MGLSIHTADRIVPDLQDLKVGDIVPLAPGGFGPRVVILQPVRALVLHGDTRTDPQADFANLAPGEYFAVTWGFYLESSDEQTTRLIERFRADYNPSLKNTLFYRVLLEPGSFIMQQKMLRGIKQRAEAAAARR